MLLELSSKSITGKLASLICIEYLRGAISCNCLFQCLQAEAVVHGVRDSPGEDFSAIPVEDYGQEGKSLGHGQVGDIGGPDLIGAVEHLFALSMPAFVSVPSKKSFSRVS